MSTDQQTLPKHAYPDRDLPMRAGHYTCGGCGEPDDEHPLVVAFIGAKPAPWPCDGYDWVQR